MALPATPPLVVPRTRTVNLGVGQSSTRESFRVAVGTQGLADLQWQLRTIAANDTAQQLRLQNPPSAVVVDNRPARAFDDARRHIVVLYGTRLATAAMRLVESTLEQNIRRTTFMRTGRLANVRGAWRWKLVTPGKGTSIVNSATDLPTFIRGTLLVLEPYSVPHATRVNQLVVGEGKLRTRKSVRVPKGQMGPPRPKQAIGFLRATVEALRSRAEFRQFAITVVFSKRFAVPGELSRKQGTGSIVLQLKRR